MRYSYPLDLEHTDFDAMVRKLELYSKGLQLPVALLKRLKRSSPLCGVLYSS